MGRLVQFLKDEEGQDLIEYALLVSFVAIVTVVTLRTLGVKVAAFYTLIGNEF